MSSPAPLLRPPMPGNRSGSGGRTPRLGLAIPATSNGKPLTNPGAEGAGAPAAAAAIPPAAAPPPGGRPSLPQLRLATPMGSHGTPQTQGSSFPSKPPLSLQPVNISSDVGSQGRSDNNTLLEKNASREPGRVSGSTSAASQYSALSFAIGLRQPQQGTPDPSSAAGSTYSDRGGSEAGGSGDRGDDMNGLPDLDKLSLEKGRPLDVEDLDDAAWRAVSMEKRIIELGSLGEGAGGAVTRCMLKGGKTVFALKIITTDPNPDVKKQIVRELHYNKDCASDHICQYYGAFVDHSTGTISIAMEFCEGGSLDSVYKEVKKLGGRAGEKVLGKVAEGVLNGLTYLHGQKIIHRDIKPSNILLCRNGQVKLCDFGVSGEFGTKGDANTFIGTSYYMAPERITGQSYTITSDVWSLGVTLLEVAQHRFPFPADGSEMQPRAGLIDLLTYIVRQPIPKLKDEPECGIRWSENFKYFIECCLEKEQSRRATPWRMLDHPWMLEMKAKKVNMAHFLREVWDWKD
ncbi:MAG: putative RNA helicase [Watsoniomyces obsoletus]|nr:MAG: putative RNA helicase [Watsoniomyces obsoletus]